MHFLRFTLDEAARDAFRDPAVPAYAALDHPEYTAAVPIPPAARLSLIADLSLDR